MLGYATVMGWSPSEFWHSTYTDFSNALRGWNEAHGQKTVTRTDVAQARAKMRAANERAKRRAEKEQAGKRRDAH
jgi:hypothetical protein